MQQRSSSRGGVGNSKPHDSSAGVQPEYMIQQSISMVDGYCDVPLHHCTTVMYHCTTVSLCLCLSAFVSVGECVTVAAAVAAAV